MARNRNGRSKTISLLLGFVLLQLLTVSYYSGDTATKLYGQLDDDWTSAILATPTYCPSDEELSNLLSNISTASFNPLRDIVLEQRAASSFPHTSTSAITTRRAANALKRSEGQEQHPVYSTFRCVQSASQKNLYPDWVRRTCHFENLYFDAKQREFQYFASPSESKIYQWDSKLLQDAITTGERIIFETLWLGKPLFLKNRLSSFKFAPKVYLATNNTTIHNGSPSFSSRSSAPVTTTKIQSPTDSVFVLTSSSYGMNFGHQLFDDALSLFSMLDTFDYSEVDTPMEKKTYQPIPFFMSRHFCKNNWPKCMKMWKRVGVNIMGIQPDTVNTTTGESNNLLELSNAFSGEYRPTIVSPQGFKKEEPAARHATTTTAEEDEHLIVRLEKVIAGQVNHAYLGCMGECTAHRVSLMYRFRKWMFQNMFGPIEGGRLHGVCSSSSHHPGRILVSLPVGNSHEEGIEYRGMEDIVAILRKTYSSSQVKAVDFSSLSMQEQALMVAKSKVLISNMGGGSASSLFLQKGATLILYYEKNSENGKVLKRDDTLYDSIGYFRVEWIPVQSTPKEVLDRVELALLQP